jgi:fructosamine-3-kinase
LRNGYFQSSELRRVERLCSRLAELIPPQPASLLHGDLWCGNVISDRTGSPAIIDPAVHFGWAEAELGMTALFGGFSEAFYRAYEQVRPLAQGWRERLEIYNLYHLLNHLNLFGSGYYDPVLSILRRYGS